uniref:EGF-like domain-containing protein n=1 Tax=Branchiostoma floridae TaxID=7739 RepID=C3ZM47_BRAFL|eukprot:XP_002590292.1 hypothetical protein BRAFLDRAFT_76538 [Branchiostoma floridae]
MLFCITPSSAPIRARHFVLGVLCPMTNNQRRGSSRTIFGESFRCDRYLCTCALARLPVGHATGDPTSRTEDKNLERNSSRRRRERIIGQCTAGCGPGHERLGTFGKSYHRDTASRGVTMCSYSGSTTPSYRLMLLLLVFFVASLHQTTGEKFIDKNGYLKWNLGSDVLVGAETRLEFTFRYCNNKGVLIYQQGEGRNFFALGVNDQRLYIEASIDGLAVEMYVGENVLRNQTHDVTITNLRTLNANTGVIIDGIAYTPEVLTDVVVDLDFSRSILVGETQIGGYESIDQLRLNTQRLKAYPIVCIDFMRAGQTDIDLNTPDSSLGVTDKCVVCGSQNSAQALNAERLYVGGFPDANSADLSDDIEVRQSFRGCLEELRFASYSAVEEAPTQINFENQNEASRDVDFSACLESASCQSYSCTGEGQQCSLGVCECIRGYGVLSQDPLECYNIDDCTPNPCQNGAVCTDKIADYNCTCTDRYKGKNCSVIRNCYDFPCLNGAECIELDTPTPSAAGRNCSCAPGYKGVDCGQDCDECSEQCNSGMCVNSISCENSIGDFVCECKEGYEGKDCSSEIDWCKDNPCGTGICNNFLTGYNCTCPDDPSGAVPNLLGVIGLTPPAAISILVCLLVLLGQSCGPLRVVNPIQISPAALVAILVCLVILLSAFMEQRRFYEMPGSQIEKLVISNPMDRSDTESHSAGLCFYITMPGSCLWCTCPERMQQLLPDSLSSPRPAWLDTVHQDLLYCWDCVLEYHHGREEVRRARPELAKVLTQKEVARLEETFILSLDHDDNMDDAVSMETLHLPLLEVLKFPYLLLHEKLGMKAGGFWPALQCLVVLFDRLGSRIWQFLSHDPATVFSTITKNPLFQSELLRLETCQGRKRWV